jgi:hypothetical protein
LVREFFFPIHYAHRPDQEIHFVDQGIDQKAYIWIAATDSAVDGESLKVKEISMNTGIRTVIYPVRDMAQAKAPYIKGCTFHG